MVEPLGTLTERVALTAGVAWLTEDAQILWNEWGS